MNTLKIPGGYITEVLISSIDEGERFRKDYGDLTDLAHSIKTHGLINPISVKALPDGTFLLVAGGRRLRALKTLGESTIPVRVFDDDLSDKQLRVLELAENTQRLNMSWQEEMHLQREIHRLQQKEHGTAVSGPSAKEGWRIKDTAAMLGVSESRIKESLSLGDKLEKLKEFLPIERYKTESDARKDVKLVEASMARRELARRAQKRSGTSVTSTLEASYVIGDVLDMLAKQPDGAFNLAVIDPPYSIELAAVKKDNACMGYNEAAQDSYLIWMRQVFKEVFRTLKQDSFCICWFGPDPWFEFLHSAARAEGFTGSRMPLIWPKLTGQTLNPDSSLASAYEMAFIFKKGSPILTKPGRLNIFNYPVVSPGEKYHPTQKPLDLAKEVLETFSFENAKVVVPFAGSGVDLVAAVETKRHAIGFDLEESFKGGFLEFISMHFAEALPENSDE